MVRMVLAMRIHPPRRPHRPAGRRSQDPAERQRALWNPPGPAEGAPLGREHEDADTAA